MVRIVIGILWLVHLNNNKPSKIFFYLKCNQNFTIKKLTSRNKFNIKIKIKYIQTNLEWSGPGCFKNLSFQA